MSARPSLSRRVPFPADSTLGLSDVTPLRPTETNTQSEADELAQLRAEKVFAEQAAAEEKQARAAAEQQAAQALRDAQRKLSEAQALAQQAAMERSYAGTMQRPHRKLDGLTYRRTTMSIAEEMDKAIDYYIKSTGGQWRDRSAFLKAATEAFFRAHPLPHPSSPVSEYLQLVERLADPDEQSTS